jgi:hypothetical protein
MWKLKDLLKRDDELNEIKPGFDTTSELNQTPPKLQKDKWVWLKPDDLRQLDEPKHDSQQEAEL